MTQKLGLKFSEVMSGGFVLGVSDPKAGEQQGNQHGSKLVMSCVVSVDDLDSFVHDPQHAGMLSGTIDFPPLGNAIPCERGAFNLFRLGKAPGEKWVVYEMECAANGRPCGGSRRSPSWSEEHDGPRREHPNHERAELLRDDAGTCDIPKAFLR